MTSMCRFPSSLTFRGFAGSLALLFHCNVLIIWIAFKAKTGPESNAFSDPATIAKAATSFLICLRKYLFTAFFFFPSHSRRMCPPLKQHATNIVISHIYSGPSPITHVRTYYYAHSLLSLFDFFVFSQLLGSCDVEGND